MEPEDTVHGQPDPPSPWAFPDATQESPHPPTQGNPAAQTWANPPAQYPAPGQPTTIHPTPNWPHPPPPAGYPTVAHPAAASPLMAPDQNPFAKLARQRRRRAVITVLVSLAAVAALCGGVIALAEVAPHTNIASSIRSDLPASGQTTGAPASTAAAVVNGAPIRLTAPDHIGTLTRSADQSGVQAQFRVFPSSDGTLVAVVYDDGPAGKVVIFGIATGATATADPVAQLDQFFAGAGRSTPGATIGTRTGANPGAAGGVAQCADYTISGNVGKICGWVRGGAVVGATFVGSSAGRAGSLLAQVLEAIVS